MRISDWSSDVCSSDLSLPVEMVQKWKSSGTPLRRENFTHSRRLLTTHLRSQSLNFEMKPRTSLDNKTEYQYPGSLVCGEMVAGFMLAVTIPSRQMWEMNLIVIELNRSEFEALRSEEHTSELQSLMRISYAV